MVRNPNSEHNFQKITDAPPRPRPADILFTIRTLDEEPSIRGAREQDRQRVATGASSHGETHLPFMVPPRFIHVFCLLPESPMQFEFLHF